MRRTHTDTLRRGSRVHHFRMVESNERSDRSSYTPLLSMNNLMKRNEKAINIVLKSTTIAWRTFQVNFYARCTGYAFVDNYDFTTNDLLIWHRCTHTHTHATPSQFAARTRMCKHIFASNIIIDSFVHI